LRQFRDDHNKIGFHLKNIAKSNNIPDVLDTDKAMKAAQVPELLKVYNDFKAYDAILG
jgi:hypothetical protein